jgi:RecB family exonuclease
LPAPPPFRAREQLALGAVALEPVVDDSAPALASARAHGGARVLELQAQCPFRAFAELRLRASALEEPQAGIDRRLRGQVLHRSLERLWADLGSQQALLALGEAACERLVATAVDAALADARPAGAGPRSLRLEREWQQRAIAWLLVLERARPPFRVAETEREMRGTIGGLELRLRVDRVDESAGGRVVIDYKTGTVRGTPWRGARMDAPQLPLYAVLHAREPAAIAIAQAGVARARFVGVGDDAAVFDGLVTATEFELTEERESGFEWVQVTARWRAWLERLARDHAAGCSAVDPKLGANTCRRCHLAALCRVEAAPAADEDPEEQSDER